MEFSDAYFLFNKGSYELKGVRNENLNLPSISNQEVEKYKEMGMEIVKVKYSSYYETYRVFDPQIEEYKEVTLPLRAFVGDKEVDCKKNHTEKFPTDYMVKCAEEKYNEVYAKIRFNDLVEQFKTNTVDGKVAYIYLYGDEKDILTKSKEYSVELVNYLSGAYLAFKNAEINPDTTLKVKVPDRDMGLVIGKGGSNLKSYSKKYNFKFMQVLKAEDL